MITFSHWDTERKAVIIQISFLQGDKLVSGKFFLDILLFRNQKLIKIKCSRSPPDIISNEHCWWHTGRQWFYKKSLVENFLSTLTSLNARWKPLFVREKGKTNLDTAWHHGHGEQEPCKNRAKRSSLQRLQNANYRSLLVGSFGTLLARRLFKMQLLWVQTWWYWIDALQ